jgi:organic hydroperoxide reductase OsmC/OhrA
MNPKRAPKLFHYKTKSTWCSARRGMLSAAGKPNIVVGSPPEFKGEPALWAPDELLIGSLNTCMMLTFLAFAQAQGLTPVGYESEAELEPARKTMESAEVHRFIANSINAKITLTPEFVVAPRK